MIYTPVKLDKNRNILLGFKALQEFKNITGKSLTKINFEDENSFDIEEIVPAIFYSGLKHEDRELTLDKVISLIDEHLGIKGAIELIPQIMKDAFGTAEGTDIKN